MINVPIHIYKLRMIANLDLAMCHVSMIRDATISHIQTPWGAISNFACLKQHADVI